MSLDKADAKGTYMNNGNYMEYVKCYHSEVSGILILGKASACNAGHPGSIPGSGRSPGEGSGNPLQHSCLENPMDQAA